MRALSLFLVGLILALQYPIWLGKGGWLQVRELDRQLDRQKTLTRDLRGRNESLEAEVRDLKQGVDAIEERARSELGMVRRDEVFFLPQPGEPAGARAPVSVPLAPAPSPPRR